MCQAYEGERAYLLKAEAWLRERGYKAFQAGKPRDMSSWQEDHCWLESDIQQWQYGYDTAAEGRELW